MVERVLLVLFLIGVIVSAGFFLQLPLSVYEEPTPAGTTPSPAREEPESGERLAALEALIERLTSYPDPSGGLRRVRLLPGELPSGLPFEIPLPPEARVIGSAVGEADGTILLDVPQSPEEVEAFYARELAARGWEEQRPYLEESGFVSAGVERGGGRFCRGKGGPSLRVSAFVRPEGTTDLRIFYTLESRFSFCDRPRAVREKPLLEVREEVLPRLVHPEGSRQRRGGGGASDDYVSSYALVRLPSTSAWSAEGLRAYYAEQLRAAGWTPREEGKTGAVAWSRWDVAYEGERWQGLLFVVDRGEGWFFTYLRADLMEP